RCSIHAGQASGQDSSRSCPQSFVLRTIAAECKLQAVTGGRHSGWRFRGAIAIVALAGAVALIPGASAAQAKTVWLCKPGIKQNPCTPSMKTTRYANDGQTVEGTYTPKTVKKPKIDCFYVYPTVSDDKTDNSDLSIDPEERSIALYQAARYSQECRVYAPMYRQVTITRLL